MAQVRSRPRLEVADILRLYGGEYQRIHKASSKQITVMRHIASCRTAALGGHKDTCDTCGHIRISYNSCRDRHCPKCQNLKKAEWLESRKERLLPVPYFHVVFTLPEPLRPLVLQNKRALFDLLFHAAAQTILTLARDKKHLGAQVGFTAILHTWTQHLLFHPHLHCVVTGGGLSKNGDRWVKGSAKYFLPVKVLGRMFRGKFLHGLKRAFEDGRLRLSGRNQKLGKIHAWKKLVDELYGLNWVVYAKPPFGGPEYVFRYLGRYTHRVAIANHRLMALKKDRVQFQIRNRDSQGGNKTLDLDAVEFIRRFLLHVLPRKFTRIRHYGLLAGRNIHTKLEKARHLLLGKKAPSSTHDNSDQDSTLPWWERLLRLTGVDIMACPVCGTGRFMRIGSLAVQGLTTIRSPPHRAICNAT